MKNKRYEPVQTKQILNRIQNEWMPYDWSINPYRGCEHGCRFCFSRAYQAFIGKEAGDAFENQIQIKINAPERLEEQLQSLIRRKSRSLCGQPIGTVVLGTATDPYQPIEAKAELTRKCLRILAHYHIPTSIVTRSPLILRDMDILKQMNLTSVLISLHTLDAAITRKFEPASPLPFRRMELVQTLAQEGIAVGLFIAPILPFLTDSTAALQQLIKQAREHQAAFALFSVLRLTSQVKPSFFQALQQHDPKLLQPYLQLYRLSSATADYTRPLALRVEKLLSENGLASHAPSPVFASPCPQVEQLTFDF